MNWNNGNKSSILHWYSLPRLHCTTYNDDNYNNYNNNHNDNHNDATIIFCNSYKFNAQCFECFK